jgi:sugar/nucleoside kinase (ribokinase family)
MNKFDVYAVGNALVDIEYHASVERLNELGIEKGVMTLIDEQRQNDLMRHLGESHEKMTCGGSAANSIIALAQFGANTHLDCRVSNDFTGQFFARDLHDSGVNSSLQSKQAPAGVTGKCLVFVTPDADRTMNTFLGASADLDGSDVDEEAISNSEYVYIEGYLSSADNTRDAAVKARTTAEQQGIKTALTLSDPNMVKFFRDSMEAMIGDGVDLLFANEEEALELAGTTDFYQAIQKLKTVAKMFAVTRGKDGAVVYDGNAMIDIAPSPVEAIDTLGAGDMFAGAFLYGLSSGMNFQQCGNLASMASSKIVTQYGPRLDPDQTRAILDAYNSGN